jgi:hypothetical protein
MSSPDPGVEHLPRPRSFLLVQGDPTLWGLDEEYAGSPPWLTKPSSALAVVTPLSGKLLLAPRHAGSLVLYPPPEAHDDGGWVPCIRLPASYLYLPSTTGVSLPTPGYALAPGTDLNTLQREILNTMDTGSLLQVGVSVDGIAGAVSLDGAHLPFVVLANAELATSSQ